MAPISANFRHRRNVYAERQRVDQPQIAANLAIEGSGCRLLPLRPVSAVSRFEDGTGRAGGQGRTAASQAEGNPDVPETYPAAGRRPAGHQGNPLHQLGMRIREGISPDYVRRVLALLSENLRKDAEFHDEKSETPSTNSFSNTRESGNAEQPFSSSPNRSNWNTRRSKLRKKRVFPFFSALKAPASPVYL